MKRLFKNTKLMLGLAATLFIVGAVFITKGIIDSNRVEPGWESLAYSKIETRFADAPYGGRP